MSLDLDEETLAELGWSTTETSELKARSTQSYANESPAVVKARVYEWRAKNPGWWLRDSWRKSEAGREASRRAGARYRAKVRTRKAAQSPLRPQGAIIDARTTQ